MAKSNFKTNQFDPILLLSQMIAFQAVNYTTLGFLFLSLDLIVEEHDITLTRIFDLSNFDFSSVFFFRYGLVYLIHTIPSMFALMFIVERAKLCMDFVITYHIWHFVFSAIYCDTLPFSFMAFCLFSLTTLITTLGGEYLCMNRELRPIQLAGGGNNNRSSEFHSTEGASGSLTNMLNSDGFSRDKPVKRRDSNDGQIQVVVMGNDQPTAPEAYELAPLNTLISRVSSPSLSTRGTIDYDD